jgi:hypothetical protein
VLIKALFQNDFLDNFTAKKREKYLVLMRCQKTFDYLAHIEKGRSMRNIGLFFIVGLVFIMSACSNSKLQMEFFVALLLNQ